MTREQAINELTDLLPEEFLSEYAEAIRMAIKALEQKPCNDAISRQDVLDALDKSKYSNEFCEEHHIDWSINLGMAHIVVNELKPVTPKPKMGRWIEHIHNGMHYIECQQCSSWFLRMHLTRNSYCPNCGAEMSEIPTGAEGSDKE